MELCSLPNFWPFPKSILALFIITAGIPLFGMWLFFAIHYFSKQPMVLRQATFWRAFIKMHRKRWLMSLTTAVAGLGLALFILQVTRSDPCFLSPSLFDCADLVVCFLGMYLLWGARGSQGIGCYIDDNLKVTWDDGDLLSLHLSGRPDEIKSILRNDFSQRIDKHAAAFESAGLPNTIRVESWLFLRKGTSTLDDELCRLRALMHLPKATKQLVRLDSKPDGLWRSVQLRYFRYLLFFRLIMRIGQIGRCLNRMSMPALPKVSTFVSGAPTTPAISLILKDLQILDAGRRVSAMPIRKLSSWEAIALVTHYPELGVKIFPWATGFQFSK